MRVIGPDGAPLEGVRFRLIPDAGPQEMAAVARFGFLPATPLDDRLDDVGEGRWVFRDLPAGSYRLEASAPGFEIASDTVEVLANLERTLMETLLPADADEDHHGNGQRVRSFKRWLYGTSRVLPATWRQDAAALREAIRARGRGEKS